MSMNKIITPLYFKVLIFFLLIVSGSLYGDEPSRLLVDKGRQLDHIDRVIDSFAFQMGKTLPVSAVISQVPSFSAMA